MNINTFGLSLSGLVLIAQALGFSAILWGAWRLISGLRGEGQSAEGVAHLRAELLGLLKPMLIGLLAVATLMGVALWERSPLTRAIQLIAPLSTLVWVLWSHYSAKKVNPGQLFEALVPLSISAPPELRARAEAWADQAHPLNARGLMQTTARAVQDLKMEGASFKSVGVEESLELTKESLIALHEMTTRFPLARLLTLTDWLYEGERLTARWSEGLTWIGRGRALLNPFTLLDHKRLWRWSKGKPAELFQRELSAWLHQALYLLVSERLAERLRVEGEQGAEAHAEERSAQGSAQGSEDAQAPSSALWSLLAFKFTAPFWLYLLLSAVALSVTHGLWGLGASALGGALLWWSTSSATALESWRASFERLSRYQRPMIAQSDPRVDRALGGLTRLSGAFEETLERGQPLEALARFAEEGSLSISASYERALRDLKQPNPTLKHLNATLPDLVATLYWLCDDFITFKRGLSGGVLFSLAELIGNLDERLDSALISALERWSSASEEEPLAPNNSSELQGEPQAEPQGGHNELMSAVRSGDAWVREVIYEGNFAMRLIGPKAVEATAKLTQRWLKDELSERLNALYRGDVSAPGAPSQATLKLKGGQHTSEPREG